MAGATTGNSVVTFTLPTGISAPRRLHPVDNPAWSCVTSGSTVTCTDSSPIPAGAISKFTIPLTPLPAAFNTTPTLNAGVSSPNDNNPANDGHTGRAVAAVLGSPDVTTTVGTPSPVLKDGVTSTLPVTVTDRGTGDANGPTVVTIPLPPGITAQPAPSPPVRAVPLPVRPVAAL